ncbi:MAG: Mur ligase domain-containing protein [Luteolibacter sp.]
MILRDLAAKLTRVTVAGSLDQELTSITDDSRKAGPGILFVAVRGEVVDGHDYIDKALEAGSTVIVAESAQPRNFSTDVTWLHVPDSRYVLAVFASAFNGDPWKDMAIAGVTGTNGKTTTAFLVHHLMKTRVAPRRSVGHGDGG